MSLTEKQNEKMRLMLEALRPLVGESLTGRSGDFVAEQVERHEQYGAAMFFSDKQWSWLEDIYVQHIGPLRDIPYSNNRTDVLGED